MSRRKRGAAGREPVTEATLRADSLAYVGTKMAYHLAFSELWAFPSDRDSIAAHTAVVLGKLLEYQEAFKAMVTNDALFLLRGLQDPEERKTAERLYRTLLKKLDRASVLEQELRVDRVVFSAYVLACLRRSGGNG
jgi:hypothetical protein